MSMIEPAGGGLAHILSRLSDRFSRGSDKAEEARRATYQELVRNGRMEEIRGVEPRSPTQAEIQMGEWLADIREIIKDSPSVRAVARAMSPYHFDKVVTFLDSQPVRELVWKVRKTDFALEDKAKFYNGYHGSKRRAAEDIYRAFGVRL